MDRLDQLPGLDDFLSALRFAGVQIGPRELVWLRHAFSLEPSLDRQGLRDLLSCTLIKHDAHRELFESLFTDWCPLEEPVIPESSGEKGTQARHEESTTSNNPPATLPHPTPQHDTPPNPEKPRQPIPRRMTAVLQTFSRRWRIALLLILSTTLGYYLWPPQTLIPVTSPPTQPTVSDSVQPVTTALPANPAPEFWTWVPEFTIHTPSFFDSVWAAGTLALLSGLTGLLLWWWYRDRSKLPSQEPPPRSGPTWVPLSSAQTTLTELIDREALRTTVWGVERFVSEDELPAVDVDRTVAATARAGGLPTIHHQHAVYPREVWLWHDVMVQDPIITRILRELEGSLARAGLPVRVGRFAETPTLIGWREGQEFSPLVLEGHRQNALVAILTDGYGIRLATQSALDALPLTQVLKAFGEWPRLTFVDVTEGKHGLARSMHAYGVRCIAPQDIPAFLAASAATTTASRQRESELFGDLRVWAAATALSPDPVTEERAFALRQRLGLDLSPWRFRDLLRESGSSGGRITWSAKDRAMHVNWLTQCSIHDYAVANDSPLALALAYWIEQYREESAQREQHKNALLPWAHTQAEQRLRMEIALLRLWREPKEAIENLYGLYGTLKEEVHERLAEFTTASTVPSFPRRRE